MAAKKIQAQLTPEEKLQQALVPEAEQPYKVPENWCYFFFTALIDIEGGTQPPKSQFVDEPLENYVRLVQIRDFASNKYAVYVPDSKKLRHFENNDILIARYGASLGRICTGMSGVYNVALAKIIFSENILNRKYVYWMLQSDVFQIPLLSISRTAQAGFNKDDLSTFSMPLPPLVEQQRIVERIESLFAKLDEAKENMQNVLDGFETRKAAILHKAFTGELTAKWRKQHGVSMDSWEEKKLGDVADTQYGYTESASSEAIGPKFLRITDIQNGIVNWDKVPYCRISEEELEKYKLSIEDIVIARTGATTGKSYLIKDNILSVFASYLIRLKLKTKDVLSNFIYQFMQSQLYWTQITDFSKGIAQPGVNAQKLKEIKLLLPTFPEQTEIVRIIDDLLVKEQQAKKLAENTFAKIDLIKKSILARAFRGELGTNNLADEPAVELLKRVL